MARLAITLPNGRKVGLSAYARAWKTIAGMNPDQTVKGWDIFPTPAGVVLANIRAGMHARINRHDRTQPRADLTDARLFSKRRAAAIRGAVRYECKWCGSILDPLRVNPNNPMTKFCDAECRRSYA